MPRQRKPKSERLAEQVQFSLQLQQAFSHPLIAEEVRKYRSNLIEAMAKCEPLDDDGRRSYALQVQALDWLVDKITGKIGAGERAAQELARMDHDNG